MPLDLRTRRLAKIAVNYSIKVNKGEKIIIAGGKESIPFLTELYKEIILSGGIPIVRFNLPNTNDFFYKYANSYQRNHFPDYWFNTVKQAKGYIGINSDMNTRELTNVDAKKIIERKKLLDPIVTYITEENEKIRRVSICYPSIALAQEAGMSLTEYENFVYSTCLIDWKNFGKKLDKILKVFKKGKKIHLIGEGVDLKFDIRGGKAVADKGEENMPGGEIFMAPERESLEGWIKFDYPRIVNGNRISGVNLKFEKGKVIEFDASEGKEFLQQLLDSDGNARYVGEFGIGCNPKVNKYTNDLLFDEKMDGTIHLALGHAYKQNGGGNDSVIHVDIVKDLKKAKIILDGKIVQERGKWKI